MKNYLLILIFSCLSFTIYGKKIYTLSKEDFVKQFNDSSYLNIIYCNDEIGNKVLLSWSQNSILFVTFNDNKDKKLMLTSIKYIHGEIHATEYNANAWLPSRKINKYPINDIASFTIEVSNNEHGRPYYNIDSMRVLTAHKNDSIKKLYSIGNEHVIFLTLNVKQKKDTFLIMENACYNIKFKNNIETVLGVVQRITKDSISISSIFNQNMSNSEKKKFEIYHFPINDISEIKLLRTGGYSYKTIKIKDVPLVVIERKKEIKNRPLWYSLNSMLGEINFYRVWFTDGGMYSGITEKDGKTYWYEGDL